MHINPIAKKNTNEILKLLRSRCQCMRVYALIILKITSEKSIQKRFCIQPIYRRCFKSIRFHRIQSMEVLETGLIETKIYGSVNQT